MPLYGNTSPDKSPPPQTISDSLPLILCKENTVTLLSNYFCCLQNEVIVDVDIMKPSLYRVVFRYVNNNPNPVTAEIKLTPAEDVS